MHPLLVQNIHLSRSPIHSFVSLICHVMYPSIRHHPFPHPQSCVQHPRACDYTIMNPSSNYLHGFVTLCVPQYHIIGPLFQSPKLHYFPTISAVTQCSILSEFPTSVVSAHSASTFAPTMVLLALSNCLLGSHCPVSPFSHVVHYNSSHPPFYHSSPTSSVCTLYRYSPCTHQFCTFQSIPLVSSLPSPSQYPHLIIKR